MSKVRELKDHVSSVSDLQGKLIIDRAQICPDQIAQDEDRFTHLKPCEDSYQDDYNHETKVMEWKYWYRYHVGAELVQCYRCSCCSTP